MYLRPAHAEVHLPTLRKLIRENALGVFTTVIPSTRFPLLQSTHIPWLLDVDDEESETELGRLRGHMARQNPHSKAIIEAMKARESDETSTRPLNQLQEDVMVLFNGPVQHYVTPKFYKETKPVTGKVVPTWDYAAAQVYGRATIHFDPSSNETVTFLQKQISDLSRYAEVDVMGHDKPWNVSEAPERYIELLRKNIIGIDIEITALTGKFKMSQELSDGDREGVIQGFEGFGNDLGDRMAETVKMRGELKEQVKAK